MQTKVPALEFFRAYLKIKMSTISIRVAKDEDSEITRALLTSKRLFLELFTVSLHPIKTGFAHA